MSATLVSHTPTALFMGDFNVGKSALINALLRRDCLSVSREESHALPTFVTATSNAEPGYAALPAEEGQPETKSYQDFVGIRRDRNNDAGYVALAAVLPKMPFNRLVLVDTAGLSSDMLESVEVPQLNGEGEAMFVIVTDIEYWAAKHTMDFIAYHAEHFRGNLLVVANKADHLNADEIRRICDKAPKRMERYGITPAPPFFAVSARLENSRGLHPDEYRKRTKRAVCELCDADFDALRVALYEFETAHAPGHMERSFHELLTSKLAASFIACQKGALHEF